VSVFNSIDAMVDGATAFGCRSSWTIWFITTMMTHIDHVVSTVAIHQRYLVPSFWSRRWRGTSGGLQTGGDKHKILLTMFDLSITCNIRSSIWSRIYDVN
jgi:hypothetical protein